MSQKRRMDTYGDNYSDANYDPSVNRRNVKRKKKKSGVRVLPVVVTIIAIIIIAAAAYAVYVLKFYKPNVNNNNPSFRPVVTDEFGQTVDVDVQANENIYNFLVLAQDKVSGLTDVMMLVNYNIEEQSVSVMQLPRDTYVEFDDYSYHKLNGAYSYFYNRIDKSEKNRDRKAVRMYADFLEENLCLEIHYTALMDLSGFRSIVDAIGGVDMYVPQDMYYPDKNQGLVINLKEGYQHLDGEKAEQFVRYRSGYASGDLGRGNAQKIFITAFIKKLTESLSDVDTLTNVATTVSECIKTDLNVNDIVYFGKYFVGLGGKEKVDLENVMMVTMPGQAFSSDLSYYSMNKEAVCDIIDEYFNIYNFSITSSFDKDTRFLDENSSKSRSIYDMPAEDLTTVIYNGEEIDEDGLN